MKTKKGSMGALQVVISALIIPLVITILYVVNVSFTNSVNNGDWTTAQNTTLTNLNNNANDSFDFAGILPIALIGIAILTAIIAAVYGFVMRA